MDEKTCTVCKVEKPVGSFHKDANAADGLQPTCKSCKKGLDDRRRRAQLLAGIPRPDYRKLPKYERDRWVALADELAEAGSTYEGALQAREIRKDGIVYVITHPRLPGVKIGKAFDADSRLRGYQTGCPERAYTLSYVSEYLDDCGAIERTVHDWCGEYRLQGEWFAMTPDQAKQAIKYTIGLQRNIQQELF